jgi:hypothetical protein
VEETVSQAKVLSFAVKVPLIILSILKALGLLLARPLWSSPLVFVSNILYSDVNGRTC